jgi:hypothetical protein
MTRESLTYKISSKLNRFVFVPCAEASSKLSWFYDHGATVLQYIIKTTVYMNNATTNKTLTVHESRITNKTKTHSKHQKQDYKQ